jgi:hypothetical protein
MECKEAQIPSLRNMTKAGRAEKDVGGFHAGLVQSRTRGDAAVVELEPATENRITNTI